MVDIRVCEDDPIQDSASEFWKEASTLGLVRTSNILDIDSRFFDPTDAPHLLCRPAPSVVRAVTSFSESFEGQGEQADAGSMRGETHLPRTRTALDLGCGAGRDLAWLAAHSRTTVTEQHRNLSGNNSNGAASTSAPIHWRATGVDNLHKALGRAQLLFDDFGLSGSSESKNEVKTADGGSYHTHQSGSAWRGGLDGLLCGSATPEGDLIALPVPVQGTKEAPAPSDVQGAHRHIKAPPSPLKLPHEAYDLVILVRFLPRALLLRTVPRWVKPGGLVVLSHFVQVPVSHANSTEGRHGMDMQASGEQDFEVYDSPPPAGRIQPGEIDALLASWNAHSATEININDKDVIKDATSNGTQAQARARWEIVEDMVERIEDGRPVQSVIIRRNRA